MNTYDSKMYYLSREGETHVEEHLQQRRSRNAFYFILIIYLFILPTK